MATLLGETTSIEEAKLIEEAAPPGPLEVRLSIISPLTQEELNGLHTQLEESGIDLIGCVQQRIKGLWQISIKYRKPAPATNIAQAGLLLITMIPTALVAILVGIGIFKIEEISKALVPLLLIIGATGVAVAALATRPGVTKLIGGR